MVTMKKEVGNRFECGVYLRAVFISLAVDVVEGV